MEKDARNEQRAVDYLRTQIDMDDSEAVLALYSQIIDQEVFHTRIGYAFLEELLNILNSDPAIDQSEIPAMPEMSDAPSDVKSKAGETKEKPVPKKAEEPEEKPAPKKAPPKEKTKNKKKKEKNPKASKKKKEKPAEKEPVGPAIRYRRLFRYSLFFNIVFFLMVVIMFVLTITSNSPNILNYKNKITDEYATWEEELKEKEAELDRRESELEEREGQTSGGADQTAVDGTGADSQQDTQGLQDQAAAEGTLPGDTEGITNTEQ